MKLNEKILYCRKKAGLSQEGLAEQLGVSRQAVSKWETGDAVPEIGKLLLLAKTFDVTTDWLLSEEEPEEEPQGTVQEENTNKSYESYEESTNWDADRNIEGEDTATDHRSSSARFEKAADEWMDAVPGVLGKLVRRFGWIAGVYIAVSGAGLTGIGLLVRILMNSMVNSFNNATNSMMSGFGGGVFGGSAVTFYDENGNVLSDKESAELMKIFGNSGNSLFDSGNSMGSLFESGVSGGMTEILENNPVSIMASIMIVAGLIMLIAGTIFAVIWKKKSEEKN